MKRRVLALLIANVLAVMSITGAAIFADELVPDEILVDGDETPDEFSSDDEGEESNLTDSMLMGAEEIEAVIDDGIDAVASDNYFEDSFSDVSEGTEDINVDMLADPNLIATDFVEEGIEVTDEISGEEENAESLDLDDNTEITDGISAIPDSEEVVDSSSESIEELAGDSIDGEEIDEDDEDDEEYAKVDGGEAFIGTQTVDVETASTIVMLSFTPDEGGIYKFQSSQIDYDDTVGYLFAGNGTSVLDLDDDSAGEGQFAIVHELEAGVTYYIGCCFFYSDYTGPIELTIEKAVSHTIRYHAPGGYFGSPENGEVYEMLGYKGVSLEDNPDLPSDPINSDPNLAFAGWYDNESCDGDEILLDEYIVTGDTDFWAKWGAPCTVTLDGGEGTISIYDSETDTDINYQTFTITTVIGKTISLREYSPYRFDFIGWTYNDVFLSSYDARNFVVPGDVTLTAVFYDYSAENATVTLDANGGYFSVNTETEYTTETRVGQRLMYLPSDTPTSFTAGKVFSYWAYDRAGNSPLSGSLGDFAPTEDTILYAIYKDADPAPSDTTPSDTTPSNTTPSNTTPSNTTPTNNTPKPASTNTTPSNSTPQPSSKPAPAVTPAPQLTAPDGTKTGKGADATAAAAAILATKTSGTEETDGPSGSTEGPLLLQLKKAEKKAITVKWTKVSGATKYVVYAAKCGTKFAEKTRTTKNTYKMSGLKSGTSYKFLVMAINENTNKVVATSKVIHVYTKGGKYNNPSKITTAAKKKVTLKLNKKKTKTSSIGAKVTTKGKAKTHRKIKYESSDPSVATVNSKGKVTAKKTGSCKIYVYAASGLLKTIKITVKKK